MWSPLAIVLFSLAICQAWTKFDDDISNEEAVLPLSFKAEPPCPADADIAPCVCTLDTSNAMTLDCSNVMTDQELRNVFDRQFISYEFDILKINQVRFDSNLTTLSSGVFGNATFRELKIFYVESLSYFDSDVFDEMQDRLEILYIVECGLTGVFDEDFSPFTKLYDVAFSNNRLTEFNFISGTVTEIYLDGNLLNGDTFHPILENVIKITLNNNSFTEVPNFSVYPHLTRLLMMRNSLTTIPANTFCSSVDDYFTVSLSVNSLTSAGIVIDSICVGDFDSRVYLHDNFITTLDENIFAPIADNVVEQGLSLEANPLTCGCDIDWIFVGDRLSKFTNSTSCENGIPLLNLNPDDYLGC